MLFRSEALRGAVDSGQEARPEYNFYVEGERVRITERRRGTPIDKVVSELMIYVNTEWAAANPGSVVAVIKAVLAQYKKIDGNAAYLKEISQKFVPNSLNKDTGDAAVKKYVDLKMFPTDGGLTDANLTYTAKFFGPAPDGTGATAKLVALSSFADTTFLKRALAELGTK
mgnify:CR=1 FL=1